MCSRASAPPTVSTTRPRTSDQSHESSAEWMSTVILGSLRMFLARCLCGSVFTSTCSPSLSTHVSSACGWPSGISVTTVARFLPWARRTVSSSSAICTPRLPPSVAVYRRQQDARDRRYSGGDRPDQRENPFDRYAHIIRGELVLRRSLHRDAEPGVGEKSVEHRAEDHCGEDDRDVFVTDADSADD